MPRPPVIPLLAHWRTTGTRVLFRNWQASISCIRNILPFSPPQLHDSIHMIHGCAVIAKQVLLLGVVGGVWGDRWRRRGACRFRFMLNDVHYAPKVRNRACVQSKLGLSKARRRRHGAATRLRLGMRTEVEVEMAALRPGSEGLLMSICLSVSVHSAPGTELSC